MLGHLDGAYYAAEVRLLLASHRVYGCLVGAFGPLEHSFDGVSNLSMIAPVWDECVGALQAIPHVRIVDASTLTFGRSLLIYRAAVPTTEHEHVMLASEFVATRVRVPHLTISRLDVPLEKLAHAPSAAHVRSLDIARLGLRDEDVLSLVSSGRFRALRWLDLSGNPSLTETSVAYIAAAIERGAFALEWLDLLGTDCDATPYVDGFHWRITEQARRLALTYGYQRWMMLGSKIPEMATRELLAPDDRQTPPDRFSSP